MNRSGCLTITGLDEDGLPRTASNFAPPAPKLCDPDRIYRDMAMPADCPTVDDGDIHAALSMARKVTWGRRHLKNWPACVHHSPVYPLLMWTALCIEAGR